MTDGRKRSFAEFSEEEPSNPNSGVAQALARVRSENNQSDDWQQAMSPRSKNRKNKKAKKKHKLDHEAGPSTQTDGAASQSADGQNNKRPGLNFQLHSLNSVLKISSLQDLVLYCLADGVAPNWTAVRNHGQVRKAVVLFVPGLEQAMFTGDIELDIGFSDLQVQDGVDGESLLEQLESARTQPSQISLHRHPDSFLPVPLVADNLPVPLKPLATVFPDIWPVKAPGDDKQSKLHSPLHAMLTSPLPRAQGEKKGKGQGPRPPRLSQDWKDQPTPITSFLASVDDLQDSLYVLHPSLLSESERSKYAAQRKASGTSTGDGWQDSSAQQLEDDTSPNNRDGVRQDSFTAGRTVLALDCEMCVVGEDEYALTRVSVVGWDKEVILDELVKPDKPITNYVTQFSGITKEMLDPVKTTLGDIQQKLLQLIGHDTILIGHSLDSDLRALKLTHPFIVDTAIAYPHPRGPPMKPSLKWLAQRYLGQEIQKGDGKRGHDSIEDAKACLDLIRQKCEKGPLWGTSEASTEPIFKRLTRTPKAGAVGGNSDGKSGAIVDVGDPARSFRAMASYTIGCKDDGEVVAGVKRCVLGDDDGAYIPGGGIEFTWARFRALEKLRGWANDNRAAPGVERETQREPTREELHATVSELVSHISEIKEFLPPCTLFMVYSGTGDPRELARLQEMHRTFKKEYEIKKWDQLSVKWTDTEEQALRKACKIARSGIGFMCVT